MIPNGDTLEWTRGTVQNLQKCGVTLSFHFYGPLITMMVFFQARRPLHLCSSHTKVHHVPKGHAPEGPP